MGNKCNVGDNTEIGSHVCIGNNVLIGKSCVVGDMVTICDNVKIGDNVFIESGVAFVEKLNQRANVNNEALPTVVEDNVSIHAKAIIESGCHIKSNLVINYGEIMNRQETH